MSLPCALSAFDPSIPRGKSSLRPSRTLNLADPHPINPRPVDPAAHLRVGGAVHALIAIESEKAT
jgi:hypothetical protein